MAEDIRREPKNKLTPEEFEKLSKELWKTFDRYSGKQSHDHNICNTAISAAHAIMKLQDYKPD